MVVRSVERDLVQIVLALCGIVGPVLFAPVIAVFGLVQEDYSHAKYEISQLGATRALNAWIQNVNFVLTGLLIIAFVVGLYRAVGTDKAGKVGFTLPLLVGIGVAAAGVFPEDMIPLPPEPTLSDIMHDVSSLLTFFR